MDLKPKYGEHTIDRLIHMFEDDQINLEPGFQRRSVWTKLDRRRLIESIMSGYPLPSVFLYQRSFKGSLVYDVIDGKQRLESIFMFARVGRFKRKGFSAKLDLGEGSENYDWKNICRRHPEKRDAFQSYQIQTVEITGQFKQIVELFVRINSTGKKLTSGEKRHAKFYTSLFLKTADRLVGKFGAYMREQKILSPTQMDRMKGTELIAELLMSIHKGGPINKKAALDKAIGNEPINKNTLARLEREFIAIMGLMKRMFPDLCQTRFNNSAEYYSLFLLVWEMNKERLVLKDRRRNKVAFELLRHLSTGVDMLRQQLKKAKPAKPPQRLFSDYLLTVQGDTDSGANRERRREILRGLLLSLYERKDEKRLFSSEQRRILWNSDEKRLCRICGKPLTWVDLSVDHISPHVRGGKTDLRNAQMVHRRCNSAKGDR